MSKYISNYRDFIEQFYSTDTLQSRDNTWYFYWEQLSIPVLLEILEQVDHGSPLETKILEKVSSEKNAQDSLNLWKKRIPENDKRFAMIHAIDFGKSISDMVEQCALFPTGSAVRLLYTRKILEVISNADHDILEKIKKDSRLNGSILKSSIEKL